eukprot:5597016-Prymnesium_polylepis.1
MARAASRPVRCASGSISRRSRRVRCAPCDRLGEVTILGQQLVHPVTVVAAPDVLDQSCARDQRRACRSLVEAAGRDRQ